jgi:hypothetical protein
MKKLLLSLIVTTTLGLQAYENKAKTKQQSLNDAYINSQIVPIGRTYATIA